MRFGQILGSLGALALAVLGSASAWAQTYTVTAVNNTTNPQWVAEPTSVNSLTSVNADDSSQAFSIPFAFPYWGTTQNAGTTMYVFSNGYVSFSSSTYLYHYSPISYPAPASSTTPYDGFIAVAQRDNDGRATGSTPYAHCVWWQDTVGTSPAIKRLVVSWNNFNIYSLSGGNSLFFQVQFYETGKIVMAYTGTWLVSSSWGYGMDNPNSTSSTWGTGYVTPSGTGTSTFSTKPTSDYIYSPPITITGTVLFDRYIVDGTGIGNTSDQGKPLAGVTVEQRDSTGTLGTAVTNANGTFTMTGSNTGGTGTIVVTSQTPACVVRRLAGGPVYAATVASNVSFSSNVSIGTVSLSESNDPGGVNRAPINIARTIAAGNAWAKARTAKTIPVVDPVLYDTGSSAVSSYTKPVGVTLASMRISGAASNPDPWDISVINRLYGRHVLGAISGFPSSSYDQTLDLATDNENAFAEGFGYYFHFASTGANQFFYYDGLSPTSSTSLDMEQYVPTTPPGPNVAGWVAAALYDLTDSSIHQESWDTFDGSLPTTIDLAFRTAAGLTTTATAANFLPRWNLVGYDGAALARNFIHHGLLPDDSDEPNDFAAESRLLTQFGFIRKNRLLAQFNEDWYEFLMPDSTNKLGVTVIFDRVKYPTTTLIVQTIDAATGNVVVNGSAADSVSPWVANSGPLPAGNYRVRVALASGGPLADYTIQAFSELAFKSGAFQPWTVGRPINVPVDIKGGIPPYSLTVLDPFVKPDGLVLDGVNLRVGGIPTGPQDAPIPPGGSYTYGFILSAQDAATPPNTASGPINFTVNDTLKPHFGDFLAVPYDKDLSREAPFAGGTAPYDATIDQGLMPHGISFAPGELRLVGKADVPGSYPVQITGTDIAQSTATAQVTGVVCTQLGSTTTLGVGSSAAGFYFDAVQGSTMNIAIKTARKQPSRRLSAAVLDIDGTTVLTSKAKGGKGSASVKGFVAPRTGRFFVVVASDTGDGTQLVGVGKVTAPKGGAGANPDLNFVAGKKFAVPFGALAGAKIKFTAKPDKSGLALRALYLLDPRDWLPDGDRIVPLDFTTEVVEKADGSVVVTKTLPTSTTENLSGTWELIIGAKPGPQGQFKYLYKVTEPKGVRYTFD